MASDDGEEARNEISGGIQHGPVLQGRDFINPTFVTNQAASAPVARAQLPALVPGFTGREVELVQLTGLLDPAGDTQAAVVSAVAGLAGVGKTTLAIQAGHAARGAGWFPGGVLFIDLHGYDDALVPPGQALDSLLRALGVPGEHIPPGVEDRAGLYRSVLAQIGDPVLVIADNASSEAQVRPLLPGLGRHRVVVTSRHTLAGLGARLLDVAVLDDEAGMALLDQALRAARPDDDRIHVDKLGAVRLAGICAGLPLALQITAALMKIDPFRTVSDLADELTDEVRRLEALHYDDGSGTGAPSVAAAFELSYRRLDEATARVFRLLSVNPGPDVSTTAIAVLADLPVSDVRKVLGQLIRAHLVEAADAGGRWRMHDLLRLYARQLSDARAETDGLEQARDRLLGYYLDITRAADAHLQTVPGVPLPADFTGRDDALAWLDAERPSLIAAVTMAASTGRDQIAMLLPSSLIDYLSWRRRFDDWLAIAMICRDTARSHGDRYHEGMALNNLGLGLRAVRRFEEAVTALQDAAAIHRETGDRQNEGETLNNLGLALREARQFKEAVTALQDAAAIHRETGDRQSEGTALSNLGSALEGMRQSEEAITALQDAAAIFRDTGDRYREGMTLNNLGLVLQHIGQFKEAITAYQEDLVICQELGNRHGEATTLINLGLALQHVGRFEQAVTALQDAAVIHRETGDRQSEGMALNNLGLVLRSTHRFGEAVSAHQEAAAIHRQTGDRYGVGQALNNLGSALQGMRRFGEAVSAHQEAAAIFRETGDRRGVGRAMNNLGAALREECRFEQAITAHQDAAAIFREIGDRQSEGVARRNLEADRAAQRG